MTDTGNHVSPFLKPILIGGSFWAWCSIPPFCRWRGCRSPGRSISYGICWRCRRCMWFMWSTCRIYRHRLWQNVSRPYHHRHPLTIFPLLLLALGQGHVVLLLTIVPLLLLTLGWAHAGRVHFALLGVNFNLHWCISRRRRRWWIVLLGVNFNLPLGISRRRWRRWWVGVSVNFNLPSDISRMRNWRRRWGRGWLSLWLRLTRAMLICLKGWQRKTVQCDSTAHQCNKSCILYVLWL